MLHRHRKETRSLAIADLIWYSARKLAGLPDQWRFYIEGLSSPKSWKEKDLAPKFQRWYIQF